LAVILQPYEQFEKWPNTISFLSESSSSHIQNKNVKAIQRLKY